MGILFKKYCFLERFLMHVEDHVGKTIGEFHIEERIGRGGMATVYRARQASVKRQVALKIIPLHNTENDPSRLERFKREAETVAGLEHIHILPIYGYGVNDEIAYLAMRLLRGGSLETLLREGLLPIDRAADLFQQVAAGLAYAHHRGVIHRDLKPSNILFDDAQNAYLADFGLARMIEGDSYITQSGNVVGTPAYMAPEQLRGEALDKRTDIYSLGMILYNMLTGRLPFEETSGDLVSLIYHHLEKMPTLPRELNNTIPAAVETVVMRALEKQPEKRYSSVDLMADDLNVALGRKVSSTTYPAAKLPDIVVTHTTEQSHVRPAGTSRRLMIAGAVIAVVILGAVSLLAAPSLISAPVPIATVLPGEARPAVEIVPSSEEAARAAARLGSDGFVAYVTCNQSSEYHATQAREMSELAGNYGIDFHVYDSNADRYTQITQIERARADGASAFILCPLDADLLAGTLESIQKAGFPLVMLTASMDSYGGVRLAGDEYQMGLTAGRFAGEIIRSEMDGQARVIILDYPDLPSLITRANGLEAGVLELAPDAEIVGRYRGATREFGYESVRDLIDQGVEFDVIVSINDAGAFGAVSAMEESDIASDSVMISSIDAEALAREYIRSGYFFRGSVDVGREQFSVAAVDAMVELLAGSTLPETLLVPPGNVITREALEGVG